MNDVGYVRRADADPAVGLGPVPVGHAHEALPQLPPQPEPVGRLELRRRHAVHRRPTSTRTSCCRRTGRPARASTSKGAGIDDRSTRGGPSMRSKHGGERLVLRRVGQPQGRQRRRGWASTSATRPARPRGGVEPRGRPGAPTSFLTLSLGVGLREDERGHAVGRERRGPVDDPLRLRPHPPDDGRPADARQLHHHADAHRADLRRSRSCRPAPTATSRNCPPPRHAVRQPVRSRRPTPATPISTTGPSARTNVLRWEFKPGSALYVVWQQGREDVASAGRFRFRQDFGGLFGIPANNVFLVKFSYWLNL